MSAARRGRLGMTYGGELQPEGALGGSATDPKKLEYEAGCDRVRVEKAERLTMTRILLLLTVAGILAFPSLAAAQVTGNPACQVFRDTSQNFTTGLFRVCSTGGQFVLQQNTAAAGNFSTFTQSVIGSTAGSLSCAAFPGTSASAKIANCWAALPLTGGTADARGLQGAQTWNSDAFSGLPSTTPVDFPCGAVTFTVSTTSTIPANVHLIAGQGCIFSVNAGVTLTVNGTMTGSSVSQHFTGAGWATSPSAPATPFLGYAAKQEYILYNAGSAGYNVTRTSDGSLIANGSDAALAVNAFFTAVGSSLFFNNVNAALFNAGSVLRCNPIPTSGVGAYTMSTTIVIPPTQNFIFDCPNITWQAPNTNADMFQIDSAIDSTFNLGILSTGASNLTGAAVRVKPVTNGPDALTAFNIAFVNVLAVAGPGDGIVLDGTGNGPVNNSVFSLQECNLSGGTNRRCYTLKGGTNAISNNLLGLTFENSGLTSIRIDSNSNIASNFISLNAVNNNFPVDDQQLPSLNVVQRNLGNNFGGPGVSFAAPKGINVQSSSTSGTTVSVIANSGGVNGIFSNVIGGGSQLPFVFNVANNETARIDPVANRFLFGLTSTDIGGNTTFLSGINVVQVNVNSPAASWSVGGTGALLRSFNSNVGFIPNILIQPGLTTALILGTSGALATGTGTLPAGQGSLNVSGTLTYSGVGTANTGDFLCINNVTQVVTQGTTCTLSSEHYKHDFQPLDAGLETVLRIPTYSYVRNDHPEMGRQVGLKAEAVAKIEPRVVLVDREGKPSTVLYENYTAILTKAIQELSGRVDKLEAK